MVGHEIEREVELCKNGNSTLISIMWPSLLWMSPVQHCLISLSISWPTMTYLIEMSHSTSFIQSRWQICVTYIVHCEWFYIVHTVSDSPLCPHYVHDEWFPHGRRRRVSRYRWSYTHYSGADLSVYGVIWFRRWRMRVDVNRWPHRHTHTLWWCWPVYVVCVRYRRWKRRVCCCR